MPVPSLSEVVQSFKRECESEGWSVSQYEDWIRVGNEYHNFLWTRTVHPTTFKKIAEEHKCALRLGALYHVVNVHYTAWLFSESPPEEILRVIEENPDLFRGTAIYDMSWINSDTPLCVKLNRTESQVYQEFERFLEKTWKVKFKSFNDLLKPV